MSLRLMILAEFWMHFVCCWGYISSERQLVLLVILDVSFCLAVNTNLEALVLVLSWYLLSACWCF